jgi:hypothetical protein
VTIFVACERELFVAVSALFLLFLGMGNNVVEHAAVFMRIVRAEITIIKNVLLSGLRVHTMAYLIKLLMFSFELLSSL